MWAWTEGFFLFSSSRLWASRSVRWFGLTLAKPRRRSGRSGGLSSAGWAVVSADLTQNGRRSPASPSPFFPAFVLSLAFVLAERRPCAPARAGGRKVLKVKLPTAAETPTRRASKRSRSGFRLVTEAVSAHETPCRFRLFKNFLYGIMKKHKYQ